MAIMHGHLVKRVSHLDKRLDHTLAAYRVARSDPAWKKSVDG